MREVGRSKSLHYWRKGLIVTVASLTYDNPEIKFAKKTCFFTDLIYLLFLDGESYCHNHIVGTITIALSGFPNLTGFLNEFESLIVN